MRRLALMVRVASKLNLNLGCWKIQWLSMMHLVIKETTLVWQQNAPNKFQKMIDIGCSRGSKKYNHSSIWIRSCSSFMMWLIATKSTNAILSIFTSRLLLCWSCSIINQKLQKKKQLIWDVWFVQFVKKFQHMHRWEDRWNSKILRILWSLFMEKDQKIKLLNIYMIS